MQTHRLADAGLAVGRKALNSISQEQCMMGDAMRYHW